jgi:rubrerythrin
MNIENMSIEDVLGMAVRTEMQAHNFYSNLAGKIGNLDVKKKILSLAADELRHKGIMEGLYRKTLGKEPNDLPSKGVPDILRAIAALQVNDKTQVLHVLDMAIEAEAIAAKFYHHGAQISTDTKMRMAFEELEREEDGHFNYLTSERGSLSGDLYWFSINDSAMMEE